MTLDDAVKVLNEWRHNGINNWRIEEDLVVGDFREYRSVFEPFDAIAIAEKLRRKAGRAAAAESAGR